MFQHQVGGNVVSLKKTESQLLACPQQTLNRQQKNTKCENDQVHQWGSAKGQPDIYSMLGSSYSLIMISLIWPFQQHFKNAKDPQEGSCIKLHALPPPLFLYLFHSDLDTSIIRALHIGSPVHSANSIIPIQPLPRLHL